MPIVIYTLILFFTLLIVSQIFLATFHSSVIEGLENGFQSFSDPANAASNAFASLQQKASTGAQQVTQSFSDPANAASNAFASLQQKASTGAQQVTQSFSDPANAASNAFASLQQKASTGSQQIENGFQPYDPNNASILAQQNAGNIEVLKQQIDSLNSLNNEVQDISGNVAKLQSQVTQLIGAQQQYVQQVTPSTTPTITGATT